MGEIVVKCRQEVALENRIHILSDEGDIMFQRRIQESEQCDPKEDQRKIIIQPLDDWLPITQSRKGNSWTAIFHLLCSGIGIQTLILPLAFVYLGWFWGITCLSVAFMWQFYTIGLLVSLHESVPGILVTADTFIFQWLLLVCPKLGKALAIFPVMYLSGGTCVMFIITGGGTMKLFYQLVCKDCSSKHPLSTTQWFLVFTCLAIIVSMLCPDMHSVSLISFLGAIMVVGYCTILWISFVAKGRVADTVYSPSEVVSSEAGLIRSILNALGIFALVFRGHNVVLEIQGAMPATPIRPSSQLMWKGVITSYVIIALCFFPHAIVGYWSFGNKIPIDGGLLTALSTTLNNHTSKPLISLIYIQVSITCLTSFQIYSMVVYDNLERAYANRKSTKCPKSTRIGIKIFFGCLTFFISVAFPFLPSLGLLIGGIALPLTFGYPSLIWITIKKPPRTSLKFLLNFGLGCLGIGLSVLVVVGAVWNLACRGLDANFFHPH